jgi:hypothetical protein
VPQIQQANSNVAYGHPVVFSSLPTRKKETLDLQELFADPKVRSMQNGVASVILESSHIVTLLFWR